MKLGVIFGSKSTEHDVSVVSFPCLEVFEEQSTSYKNRVLQKNAHLRVAIEASNDTKWYKYVGDNGLVIGVNNYQGSGNGAEVYSKAGFNEKDIIRQINRKLAHDEN